MLHASTHTCGEYRGTGIIDRGVIFPFFPGNTVFFRLEKSSGLLSRFSGFFPMTPLYCAASIQEMSCPWESSNPSERSTASVEDVLLLLHNYCADTYCVRHFFRPNDRCAAPVRQICRPNERLRRPREAILPSQWEIAASYRQICRTTKTVLLSQWMIMASQWIMCRPSEATLPCTLPPQWKTMAPPFGSSAASLIDCGAPKTDVPL